MAGNLTLALEALATSGVLVPSEQRAALSRSLAVKQQEARLASLSLWGRILTANGRDYLLARGCNSISRLPDATLRFDTKYYYSQDGVKWMDLQALSEETYEACKTIRGCFTGEPSHVYSVILNVPSSQNEQFAKDRGETQEGVENQEEGEKETPNEELDQEEVEIRQDNDEDAEEAPGDDAKKKASKSGLGSRTIEIGELDRLSTLMKQVDYECGVIPKGAMIYDAKKELVKNVHFPGVNFLQSLDSYAHLFQNYEDTPLSNDVRGSWSLELTTFEGVVLRSLWWPGYAFYYTSSTKDFGSLYFGLGERNIDIPFMV